MALFLFPILSHLTLLTLVFRILFISFVLFQHIHIEIYCHIYIVILKQIIFYVELVHNRYYMKVHLLRSTIVSAT